MGVVLASININFEKYENCVLGNVIQDNFGRIIETEANELAVIVCNEYWHGCFLVPLAMGFSTPVSILRGASICLCRNVQVLRPVVDAFIEWQNIYGGRLVRQDLCYTFSRDKTVCQICLHSYKDGENLIVVRKCGHVFHQRCLTEELRAHNLNLRRILRSKEMEETIPYDCPVCQGHVE